jgi:putative nucleotidyltransferase with HDIG domain
MFNSVKIDKQLLKSLVTLGSVIEARDKYTGGHVYRVGQYARKIGDKLGLPSDRLFALEVGGLVHDLGKIGTPDAILNKRDKLTDSEYEMMKNHVKLGADLVKNHPLESLVIDSVSDHHERLDGKGYPESKDQEHISLHARIMSVSDAFDAMTSARPYRQGMPAEKALEIMRSEIGTQFHTDVVEALSSLFEEGLLDGILGHAGFERKMLACPVCGPTIAPTNKQKDGDKVMCPACTGEYVLHRHGESYDIEFTEKVLNLYEPKVDEDVVNYIVKVSPKKVNLSY